MTVADRGSLEGAEAVWEAVSSEGEALEGRGRVLVRASGTEPLVRVMVEAPEREECDAVTDLLVAVVERELGLRGREGLRARLRSPVA